MTSLDLAVIRSPGTDPYRNLGLEEYLTTHTLPGQCILYLWQNSPTVVIGRNQNCWAECCLDAMEKDGVLLARRLSGGGAVYHDLGNINFTFMAQPPVYNVSRHLDVILTALSFLGITAEKTGRNDLTIQGRKFSGNAFYRKGEFCCHHGTLLIHADTQAMGRYLSVSREKLASKGIASVHARVINLKELAPELTPDLLADLLIRAFGQVYEVTPRILDFGSLPQEEIRPLWEDFSSRSWLYGRKIPFNCRVSRRFSWGSAELLFEVNEGHIRQVQIYSDGMDQEWILCLPDLFKGLCWEYPALIRAMESLPKQNDLQLQMEGDLKQLLLSCFQND